MDDANRKASTAANGSGLRNTHHSNSISEQRTRMLRVFADTTITTLYARRDLDLMHPGGRIMELRRNGYLIDTVWAEDATDCDWLHRVALYVLRHEAANDASATEMPADAETLQNAA